MSKVNQVEDFLIKMAEDPAKLEEYKRDPNKVLSSFPDDIKLDIVSGIVENIRKHMKHHPHGRRPPGYGLDPD